MYNRYIPQPDGSYQRNRMQEEKNSQMPAPPPPRLPPEPEHRPPPRPVQHSSVPGFLRQLLPKDFDTGDLIVVLLLLLMAGDKPEDRNTALMTLALYCFL